MKPVHLKGLAWRLGIPLEDLQRLAKNAGRSYRPFKRKKPGKKPRLIDNPTDELKDFQRTIDRKLLKPLALPQHIQGGVPKRSPLSNAALHLGKPCVIRIDLKSFFPHVTPSHVREVWRELSFTPGAASLLTSLTTYRGHLPQGAPTSSSLANLVLNQVETEIRRHAEALGVTYARFVDDIVFSGDDPRTLISGTVRTLQEAGFPVSHSKLKIMPGRALQEVTGLSVNSPHAPSVPRYKRDKVKAAINELARLSPNDPDFCRCRRSVEGRIQHLRATNPGTERRFRRRLASALSANEPPAGP